MYLPFGEKNQIPGSFISCCIRKQCSRAEFGWVWRFSVKPYARSVAAFAVATASSSSCCRRPPSSSPFSLSTIFIHCICQSYLYQLISIQLIPVHLLYQLISVNSSLSKWSLSTQLYQLISINLSLSTFSSQRVSIEKGGRRGASCLSRLACCCFRALGPLGPAAVLCGRRGASCLARPACCCFCVPGAFGGRLFCVAGAARRAF